MSNDTRNAVITGASGAIGGSLAAACAAAGYRLHLVCRNAASLEASAGPGAAARYSCDLNDDADVERLSRELSALARVALLVHAAGSFEPGAVSDVAPEVLDSLYRVNLRTPYALTRALLPALRAAGGQIVFVNSSAGVADGRAGTGAYSATKHGLRALADAVRAEENAAGVRVLSVYPGRTAGAMQARLHSLEGRPYHPDRLLQPVDVAQAVLDALAVPVTAEVTDLHIRPRSRPAP
jgi:NAD(P)-dependent dehydrogenase (short-subunit alcohol dehydrogenase family)